MTKHTIESINSYRCDSIYTCKKFTCNKFKELWISSKNVYDQSNLDISKVPRIYKIPNKTTC